MYENIFPLKNFVILNNSYDTITRPLLSSFSSWKKAKKSSSIEYLSNNYVYVPDKTIVENIKLSSINKYIYRYRNDSIRYLIIFGSILTEEKEVIDIGIPLHNPLMFLTGCILSEYHVFLKDYEKSLNGDFALNRGTIERI